MDRFSPTSLYSITEEINPQDYQILRHGGTSSNIERLPSRLQRAKTPTRSTRKQIEDLAYEVSYLKAELAWHEQMYHIFHRMEDALVQVNTRLQEAEQRYLSIWGLSPEAGGTENMI
ncbi:uncharacterized protein BDW43DRAFT_302010 [Aspergillus alliaceus]|uniref:uncharacterized protein n=1 Tax=Petromyces alliaceus TaxID=209559 RepID=UPI0012A69D7E|nr:uncharacterized protein BDW43DRAFT_302010 [Aspergillus alliaceus]KAB8230888.1 hypothetical protein BDW43DRAFT_302010 [Aspergillus alliaceus]